MTESISILLPVFGRSELLQKAMESVLEQSDPYWRLIIADDGSDYVTQSFIEDWLSEHPDKRIKWVRRPRNVGLFTNLNLAIESCETSWLALLCSDDLLLPCAIARIRRLRSQWSNIGLILSTFESINNDGSSRPADCAWHHDQISKKTTCVGTEQMLSALLQWGSINGNLTGMAFSRQLWERAGGFRDNWRHAADWEWLIRVANQGPIILNRSPIARVRTHDGQLSNSNRRHGYELEEVADVVAALVSHPKLAQERRRYFWAGHVMQFQLWNLIKGIQHQTPSSVFSALGKIHHSAGIRHTVLGLIRWLPTRWQKLMSPDAQ